MTLKQIAERFEEFLDNDIEGLGNAEKNELFNCCLQLRKYGDRAQQVIDILYHDKYEETEDILLPRSSTRIRAEGLLKEIYSHSLSQSGDRSEHPCSQIEAYFDAIGVDIGGKNDTHQNG